jgi:hypothetical protein
VNKTNNTFTNDNNTVLVLLRIELDSPVHRATRSPSGCTRPWDAQADKFCYDDIVRWAVTAEDKHATMEEVLAAVFSIRSVSMLYK